MYIQIHTTGVAQQSQQSRGKCIEKKRKKKEKEKQGALRECCIQAINDFESSKSCSKKDAS